MDRRPTSRAGSPEASISSADELNLGICSGSAPGFTVETFPTTRECCNRTSAGFLAARGSTTYRETVRGMGRRSPCSRHRYHRRTDRKRSASVDWGFGRGVGCGACQRHGHRGVRPDHCSPSRGMASPTRIARTSEASSSVALACVTSLVSAAPIRRTLAAAGEAL